MILLMTPVFLILLAFIGVMSNTNNLVFILMYLELMLMSATMIFTLLSVSQTSYFSQCYSMYILTVAAVESAILITIVVQFFSSNNTMNMGNMSR